MKRVPLHLLVPSLERDPLMPVMTDDPFLWLEDVEGAASLDRVRAQNARTLRAARVPTRVTRRCTGRRWRSSRPPTASPIRAFSGIGSPISGRTIRMFAGFGAAPAWHRSPKPSRIGGFCSTSTRCPPPRGATGSTGGDLPAAGLSPLPRQPVGRRQGRRGAARVRRRSDGLRRTWVFPAGGQTECGLARRRYADRRTRLGAGNDDEASGYPFVLKRLGRGMPLGAAEEMFRGAPEDVSTGAGVLRDPDGAVRAVSASTGRSIFSRASAT